MNELEMKATIREMDEELRRVRAANTGLSTKLKHYEHGLVDIRVLLSALAAMRLEGSITVKKRAVLDLMAKNGG